jgi:hypothetical protein
MRSDIAINPVHCGPGHVKAAKVLRRKRMWHAAVRPRTEARCLADYYDTALGLDTDREDGLIESPRIR